MNQFNSAPGENKIKWEKVVEEYAQGFVRFAQLSRKLNEGVSFSKGEVPEALVRLRSQLRPADLIAIKGILKALE